MNEYDEYDAYDGDAYDDFYGNEYFEDAPAVGFDPRVDDLLAEREHAAESEMLDQLEDAMSDEIYSLADEAGVDLSDDEFSFVSRKRRTTPS